MKGFSSTVLALLLSSADAAGSLDSKMNAKPAIGGFEVEVGSRSQAISSKVAIYIGTCSSDKTFEFTIGGKAGTGAIGFDDTARVVSVIPTDKEEAGEVDLIDKPSNFLGWNDGDIQGYRMTYSDFDKKEGSTLKVLCANEEEGTIIVMVSDEEAKPIDGILTNEQGGQDFVIMDESGIDARIDRVDRIEKKTPNDSNTDRMNLRRLSINPITSDQRGVKIPRGQGETGLVHLSIIQMIAKDSEGYVIPRTVAIKDDTPGPNSHDLGIQVIEIKPTDDGDAELNIADLCKFSEDCPVRVKMDLRVGIECNGNEIPVVDMSAIIPTDDPKVIVNGGWIRSALHSNDVCDTDDWSIIVLDAIASDPMDGYMKVGSLITDKSGIARKLRVNDVDFRNLLQATPTDEELSITEEMTVGRMPKHMLKKRRGLSTEVHKKILSHGYCGNDSPFPVEDFDDFIVFQDPNGYNDDNNWRHDEFALKIKTFAELEGIDGCGLIGHSQGGCASLHLKHYYWSCLDNANQGGGRNIQSVGSPYQGSPLAGWIADVGDTFGFLCGSNVDLYPPGAATWLGGIPTSSRVNTYYYTTSYRDRWLIPDWCNIGASLILSGLEDGTVEKSRGALPGANDMGHTQGQCHVSGMYWMYQGYDSNRNAEMNANALF